MVPEVSVNYYNFNHVTSVKIGHFQGILRYITRSGAGTGAGAEIRISGSVEPEPKEIFSAPQHWFIT
jgi:hypothetical protein